MPFIVQIINSFCGFFAVFYLPTIDTVFSAKYFEILALALLSISFSTPLLNKIIKDYSSQDNKAVSITQMLFNFSVLSSVIVLLNDFNFLGLIAGFFLLTMMQLKTLAVSENKFGKSYLFSFLRGGFPAIMAAVFVIKSFSITSLWITMLFLASMLIYGQRKSYVFQRDFSFKIALAGLKNAIYLSIPALTIWITFQFPRLFFENDAENLIIFVQSISIPLAIFSIFESRGPYTFIRIMTNNTNLFIEQLFVVVIYASLYLLTIPFLPTIELKLSAHIDQTLFSIFFFISFGLSIFFNNYRKLYQHNTEKSSFIKAFWVLPICLIGIFLGLQYPQIISINLLFFSTTLLVIVSSFLVFLDLKNS